jgi:hypothetical protein
MPPKAQERAKSVFRRTALNLPPLVESHVDENEDAEPQPSNQQHVHLAPLLADVRISEFISRTWAEIYSIRDFDMSSDNAEIAIAFLKRRLINMIRHPPRVHECSNTISVNPLRSLRPGCTDICRARDLKDNGPLDK